MENRIIKFRALNKHNYPNIDRKEWLYGFYNYEQKTEIAEIIFNDAGRTVHNGTVGQFTGRIDKNGNEVYEGDICLLKNTSEFITSTHMQGIRAVEWSDENCYFWFSGCIPLVWGGHESIEVIGNIHQNPELLKNE